MHIRIDDLRGPEIAALLEAHVAAMRAISPPSSVHALDLDRLRVPEITFWTAWAVDGRAGDALLGCGAIRALGGGTAEIKSMRTAPGHLRRGVARALLTHILAEATRRGDRTVFLETGSTPPFDPARRLYESFGFVYCGPFADYLADAFSVFMKKDLAD